MSCFQRRAFISKTRCVAKLPKSPLYSLSHASCADWGYYLQSISTWTYKHHRCEAQRQHTCFPGGALLALGSVGCAASPGLQSQGEGAMGAGGFGLEATRRPHRTGGSGPPAPQPPLPVLLPPSYPSAPLGYS